MPNLKSIISNTVSKISKLNQYWNKFAIYAMLVGVVLVIMFGPGILQPKKRVDFDRLKNSMQQKPLDDLKNKTFRNCTHTDAAKTTKQPAIASPLKTNLQIAKYDLLKDTTKTPYLVGEYPELYATNFETIAQNCIADDEIVVVVWEQGCDSADFARCEIIKIYPQSILNYHHIVHDDIQNIEIAVTYSPYSNSYNVLQRSGYEFQDSGRTIAGNMLMLDTKSATLWTQLDGVGVIGTNTGQKLKTYPHLVTTYSWVKDFANAKILSFDTGYGFDYDQNPYHEFVQNPQPFGDISEFEQQQNLVEPVYFFEVNTRLYYVPQNTLATQNIVFESDSGQLNLYLDPKTATIKAHIVDKFGKKIEISVFQTYLYTIQKLYPDATKVDV